MNQDADNRREYFGAVAKALDLALVKVAEDEYQRLSKELKEDKFEIANRVKNALYELKNLQSGKMPCYDDEWVPLFYSTWYQPSHVNLAYSMIDAMVKKTGWDGALTKSGKLHVVDFGCGTLAMQFGVALAAADALRRKERIDSIRVDLIDRSLGMIDMGCKIWDQFKQEVKEDSKLDPLSEAFSLVKSKVLEDVERTEVCEVEDRWVSAIHAVYEENKHKVENALNKLGCKMIPDASFITSHKCNMALCKLKLSLGDIKRFEIDVSPFIKGNLPQVTAWRKCLYESANRISNQFDNSCIFSYLHNDVSWNWPEANFLIYTRHSQP